MDEASVVVSGESGGVRVRKAEGRNQEERTEIKKKDVGGERNAVMPAYDEEVGAYGCACVGEAREGFGGRVEGGGEVRLDFRPVEGFWWCAIRFDCGGV